MEENLEVYGDPDKLARVFDNILRNAIAYCYENTKIEIQARMKNNKIEITFTNSGDRIPGDMLQTILKNFTGWIIPGRPEPEEQDLVLRLQKRLWNYMMDRSWRKVTIYIRNLL